MRVFFCALVTLIASARIAAAEIPPAPGSTHVVRVDVTTTDSRGRPVDTLKPGDFEIREDGVQQSLTELRLIKIHDVGKTEPPAPVQSDADERVQASRPDARLFGIFLDEYHVSSAASALVRDGLTRFVREDLGPDDLVVVMRPLDSLIAIHATSDRQKILGAIASFEGRQGDYSARGAYEQNYFAGTPARIEQLREQVTLSAVNALALHLGRLNDRRKALVVVSQGLSGPDRRRGLESLPTAETVLRSANRSNVSIYVLDPQASNLSATGPSEGDVLPAMVSTTDGRSIAGPGNLAVGLHRMAEDSSEYYLLAYESAQKPDGTFHAIQVRVRQPDVKVRARGGYWALRADEGLRALLEPPAPPPPEPPRHVSPFIRPWFGASRGDAGKTRVIFVWEPTLRVAGDRSKLLPPARVIFTALAPDNTALFEGTVLPTGPLPIDPADEAQSRAIFEAPPGQLRLRMTIEDAASQKIDSDVREITVRDLRSSVALGTPAVLRARTAREFRTLAADPAAVPVASREFSRTERLIVRVSAYAPSGDSLSLSVRLQNRLGQTLRDLPVAPAPDGLEHQIDLPLAGLAPSNYQLEIGAAGRSGAVKEVLEFRVTN